MASTADQQKHNNNSHNSNSQKGTKHDTPPSSKNGPLFDSHCHIGLGFSYNPEAEPPTPERCPHWPFLDLAGKQQCEEQFVRAVDGGVARMALVGIDGASSNRVRLISEHLNRIALGSSSPSPSPSPSSTPSPTSSTAAAAPLHCYWTAGIHPHSAHTHEREFPVIARLVREAMTEQHAATLSTAAAAPQDKAVRNDGVDYAAPTQLPQPQPQRAHRTTYSRLVAIGETGMDFFKSRGSHDDQKASLLRHLELAYAYDLPVIIHAREADEALVVVFEEFIAAKAAERRRGGNAKGKEEGTKLGSDGSADHPITTTAADTCTTCTVTSDNNEEWVKSLAPCVSASARATSPWYSGSMRGVMHCFSSDVAWMERYLALGFFISFTNNITYSRSVAIQQACARCPADRIVIETDSPFLPPQRVRGATNEPANTRDTFECACRLRGILGDVAAMEAFQTQLWLNTNALFGLEH